MRENNTEQHQYWQSFVVHNLVLGLLFASINFGPYRLAFIRRGGAASCRPLKNTPGSLL